MPSALNRRDRVLKTAMQIAETFGRSMANRFLQVPDHNLKGTTAAGPLAVFQS